MTTVFKYRIYCNTENTWVEGYGTTEPDKCYNNTEHEINPLSVQVVETIEQNTVKIAEESGPNRTQGYYAATPFTFTAAPNTTTVFNGSFPYAIAMLTCQLQVSPDMVGDNITFEIAKDTTVGYITADAAINDTTVSVNPTVIQHAPIGHGFKIGTSSCGRVLGVGSGTITFETPLTAAYSAISACKVTKSLVNSYDMNVSGIHQIGFSKIGGSYIPGGIIGTCTYVNNSSTTKKITYIVEHMY